MAPSPTAGNHGTSAQLGPALRPLGGQALARRVADRRQLARDAELGGQLLVPLARLLDEQPGRGGHRDAGGDVAQQAALDELARRDPRGDAVEAVGLRGAQPGELGRPVARVQPAARAGVDRALVEALAQLGRVRGGARVGVGVDGRDGAAVGVEPEQAVPHRRGRHRADLAVVGGGAVEHVGDAAPQRVGVRLAGGVVLDPLALAERGGVGRPQRGADGRRADVEDEDHRLLNTLRPIESSARCASPLSRVSSPVSSSTPMAMRTTPETAVT